MTATLREHPPLPQPTRLGFDDGWHFLAPTFLNLGVPVVVADHAHIGDPALYGLEPFGSRDPNSPLPVTKITLDRLGSSMLLRHRDTDEIIAITHVRADGVPTSLRNWTSAVLFVGTTYELESTWSALWSMHVGRIRVAPQCRSNREESND